LGTHGSYTASGSFDTTACTGNSLTPNDTTGKGALWYGGHFLASVTQQRWYGFGGAWGEVGDYSFTTGPLGPSPYKPPPGW
jgi:hypothetical protein